jgi:guanine nucleotide-binding protein G(I)/G(S)/G(T) subunit beta-1
MGSPVSPAAQRANDEAQVKELERLRRELAAMHDKLERKRRENRDKSLAESCAGIPSLARLNLKRRRELKGHLGKVLSLDWSPDSRHCVSVSDDGNMIVWDSYLEVKSAVVSLGSSYVTTCAFSPNKRHVASGGLDSYCTIYDLEAVREAGVPQDGFPTTPLVRLQGHSSYVSSCQVTADERHIVTSSGDMTCALWNIDTGTKVIEFRGHARDVNSVAVSSRQNIVVSGSSDRQVKVWDLRTGESVQSFREPHTSDINCVKISRDGHSFLSAGDDELCALFDLRSDCCMQTYTSDAIASPITCAELSLSGRVIFAATEANGVHMFDTLKAERFDWFEPSKEQATCVACSPDGLVMGTSSWDKTIRIWSGSAQ